MGLTEAEVIRRAIDQQTSLLTLSPRSLLTWEKEKVFIAQRMKGKKPSQHRKFLREEAYTERLDRYGR
ncbi:MAG: hypothetical protein AB1585_16030 [Thermodesulfobacteriota bacterium]